MTDKVTIYTDGASDPNPGIGGWAAILRSGRNERVLTGNDPQSTNNRMELIAAISALEALKRPCEVVLYTDSQYVRQGITEWISRWKENSWMHKNGRPVANADLWKRLLKQSTRHQIEWKWVKGHAGDQLNERVDALARQARLEITPQAEISADIPRIYVRSSCKGNPGPGGWGVVIEHGEQTEQNNGGEPSTTNNRMELSAAIQGLLMLTLGSSAQLFTTSDYVYQGATRWRHGWRQREWLKRDGKPVANADLWRALDELLENYAVRWVNAKGLDNENLATAGKLAVAGREFA